MKAHIEIPLASGEVALIDVEDWDLVSGYKWYALRSNTIVYAVANVRTDRGRSSVPMHRLLMEAPRGLEVDHSNHDGLDNRRGNLRLCTRSENRGNMRLRSNNTSGFKGVHWDRQAERWSARIQKNGVRVTLGRFETPEDAATAYNVAALERFAEFAYLNEVAS